MIIRALFVAAAMVGISVVSGCASGPVGVDRTDVKIKYEPVKKIAQFAATYSADIGSRSVDLEQLIPPFEEATPTKRQVLVEMKLLEMSREMASDVFHMSKGTEVFTVASAGVPELIETMAFAKDLTTISAPKLVCLDQQRANISILDEIARVASYEIREKDGVRVADPVVETVKDGMVFAVRPRCTDKGVEVELELVSSALVKPMKQAEVSLGEGMTGKIDLAVLNIQKLETRALVESGNALMINTLNTENGRVRVLVVTVKALEDETKEG
ncbi:MAG: hypothetical protein IT462_01010 [Planctomycetes bacterium]|nr:hypothetical protein [Planctomycetota bacterium]